MSLTRPARPPAFAVGRVSLPTRLSQRGLWWTLAAISILVNMVVTGIVARTTLAPAFAFDEVHHLLMARMVAGFPAPDGSGAGYYPGWGVLLAPLWWFTDSPQVVYSTALAIGWAIGVATIVPLAFLVRRVRLDMPRALVVAAVVSTLPSRVAQADNVFSERLLFLCVVLTALAAFRLWERPSHARALLFGLAVAATHFTHIRMLTLVLASLVWAAAFALKRVGVAMTALASTLVFYLLADRLGALMDEWLRRTPMGRGTTFLDSVGDTRPGLMARTVLGQLWGQIVGSYGLFAVGIVILVVWCVIELRRMRLGRAAWLAGTLTASFMVSTLTWALDKRLYTAAPRLDAWVYGRYIEPITALVCALALAVLVRGIRTRVWAWAVVLFAAVTVPVILWVAPGAPTWGSVTPAHIGGLMPWAWALPDQPFPDGVHPIPTLMNENSFWLWASLTTAACLLVFLLIRRWRWAAPVFLLVMCAVGAFGVGSASQEYRAHSSKQWNQTDALRELGAAFGPIDGAYDYACGRSGRNTAVGMNQLSFAALPGVSLTPYFRGEPVPDAAELIISCADTPALIERGGRQLVGFELYDSVAWIMPGPLQDDLDAEGLLRPTPGA